MSIFYSQLRNNHLFRRKNRMVQPDSLNVGCMDPPPSCTPGHAQPPVLSQKTDGYSAENGGVSWPAPWVAKKPYTLNAPTAARAAAPPDVVPVGQSMPRPDPGMAASAVAFPAYCRHFFPVICRSAKRGMRPSDCFVWCFEIAATPVLPPFPRPFGTIHQTKDTFSMVKCPDARPIVYDI